MASKAATHYLQFDIQWSSLALLFYDYALTFPLEVKYIWGSKGRASTVLYIFCRYALVANVLYLLAIANRLKQGSVLFFGSPDGLTEPPHPPPLLLSILMIVFEFSAAVLTVIRCLVAFKAAGGRKNQSKGLMNLIFEQGVLYFRLSGLLTARFLLHIRVYEDKQEARALGAAARSQVHASSTLASFRAAAGDMVSGLVSQFGDDPVETVQRGTVAGESRSSAMSGGAGLSGDVPLVEPQSGHACGSSNAA
ncbi:hypothetical protein PC9H_010182 [Pleurotus ostreatus]|uniref:DUF6533 domain-containing protein n=1 Tax=Pleurotus ostreatus TaxID=5322 RepID=A0A8H7DST1_PLEOS|nr:uncharacterized protein PC9H_010182 [Pleurotus ostreatus]KAF7424871.1 hypothetical protein PC9H_010182 [Pleurotus ostreatus]